MKTYRILKGMFKGEYTIYQSDQEYKKFTKKKPFVWGIDEPYNLEPGMYIQTLDGCYIPCLKVTKMKSKYNHFDTFFIRVPNGTFWYRVFHIRKTNRVSAGKLFAQLTPIDQSSLSGKSPRMRPPSDIEASTFVTFILAGYKITHAYNHTFPYACKMLTPSQVRRKSLNFLRRTEVLEELRTRSEAFKQTIQEKFPIDKLATELELMLQSARKGSLSHLEIFKYIAEATGAYEESSKKRAKEIDAKDAKFRELPPQHLIEKTKE